MGLLHLSINTIGSLFLYRSKYYFTYKTKVLKDITYHLENAVEYLVYDLSIEDIEERRKKAVTYRSGKCVCNFMGYPPNKISDLRQVGRKVTSRIDGKTYAVRVKKKVEDVK
jgi:hypothetical protein